MRRKRITPVLHEAVEAILKDYFADAKNPQAFLARVLSSPVVREGIRECRDVQVEIAVEKKRAKREKRFVVKNAQLGVDATLNRMREPWKVIDTTDNRIVDEFASCRAARSAASFYNRHGIDHGSWPGNR